MIRNYYKLFIYIVFKNLQYLIYILLFIFDINFIYIVFKHLD